MKDILRRPVALAVLVAAVALFDRWGSWPGVQNPNELSRLEAATALAFRGTPEFSVERDSLGRHEDFAERDGKVYSNKAPGLILLWTPLVRVTSLFLGPPTLANREAHLYLLRASTVTVAWLCALFALARLVRRLGGDDHAAGAVALALTFASPVGVYAGLGFSHALTAALLLVVAERLLILTDDEGGIGPARWAVAGAGAALAASSEYPTALPAAILLLAAFIRRPEWRGPLAALSTGLVTLVPFFAYNAAAFGGPLRLSMAYEADPQFHSVSSQGLFGIRAPTAASLSGLLLSPSRGLLPIAPWFALAAIGLVLLILRERGVRFEAATLAAAAAGLFLVIAGFPNWHGGWATGSRYLAPMMPLLALGLVPLLGREDDTPAARSRSGSKAGIVSAGGVLGPAAFFALGAGLTFVSLAAITFPHTPNSVTFPPARNLGYVLSGAWAPTLLPTTAPVIQIAAVVVAALFLARPGLRIRGGRWRRSGFFLAGIAIALLLAAILPEK